VGAFGHPRWFDRDAAALPGGGQELRRRAGTENVAGIAGFAAAVQAATKNESDLKGLREQLESALECRSGQ
jgi:cysteine desulfurase